MQNQSLDNDNQHWSKIQELGHASGIKALLWVYHLLGETILNIILVPVISYYFLTNSQARRASLEYLNRVYKAGSKHKDFIKKPGLKESYKHFLNFGFAAVDKFSFWLGHRKREDLIFENYESTINKIAKQGRGAVILSAHLGNIDTIRGLANDYSKVNALVFSENALKFSNVLKSINSRVSERLIYINEINVSTAIMLQDKIDNGEILVILADRTTINSARKVSYSKFLGEDAAFGQGPFILAGLLKCPVYLMFCLREKNTYHVYIEDFVDRIPLDRKNREKILLEIIHKYAGRLEHFCLKYPYQWYNFFDFWYKNQK